MSVGELAKLMIDADLQLAKQERTLVDAGLGVEDVRKTRFD